MCGGGLGFDTHDWQLGVRGRGEGRGGSRTRDDVDVDVDVDVDAARLGVAFQQVSVTLSRTRAAWGKIALARPPWPHGLPHHILSSCLAEEFGK